MNEKKLKKAGVDRSYGKSTTQKTTFILGHLGIVLICIWLIFFEGITKIGHLFGQEWSLKDTSRAYILLGCAILYWIRHLITLFYLIVRKVDFSEVFGLLAFMALFEIGLLFVGGGIFRDYSVKLGWLDIFALILLLFGSFLNSFSEMQRKWWKKNPENKGHCYTQGLFKYAMHINYFGDTVLFTGWCLFTGSLWTLILPLLMAGTFVFSHIPGLDSHLEERYGKEFQAYANKTKKFIPFIY